MMPMLPSAMAGRISFHDSPAKKMTKKPAKKISRPVPRSGCLATSRKGTSTSTKALAMSPVCPRPSRRWNHHAAISGVAIFRISLGWMTMPTLSQRRAPLFVGSMPKAAVSSSRMTPSVYSGTASDISRCCGAWATRKKTTPASTMLRTCSPKRAPLS